MVTATETVEVEVAVTHTATSTVTAEPEPEAVESETPEPEEPAAVSAIPKPDAAQETELLVRLGGIDARMADDRSIGRARDMCHSIIADARSEGGTYTLVELVKMRFYEDLSDSQGQSVLDAIDAGGWCE